MTTVVTLASHHAAGRSTPQELEAIQLHAHAENALSVALFYLRQSVPNVPGATRKTVQALAALGRLNAARDPISTDVGGRA